MLINPSLGLRAAYCLVLLGFIIPVALSTALWPQLAQGQWRFAGVSFMLTLIMAAVAACRIYLVVRSPTALCSPRLSGGAAFVRKLGILLIFIGLVATILEWVAGPLMRTYFSSRSESGVEFFVVAFILGMVKMTGTSGLILFELSRLLGFERIAYEHSQRRQHTDR